MAPTENLASTKTCSRCHERHDPSWFSADISRPDGLSRWCKPCCRAVSRERRWNMTAEQTLRMVQSQQGGCAICRTALNMDRHDHVRSGFCVDRGPDGTVRGFLCRDCQTGIRGFGRDVDRLRRAMEYLTRVAAVGQEEELI